jgi:hypothetical protein
MRTCMPDQPKPEAVVDLLVQTGVVAGGEELE